MAVPGGIWANVRTAVGELSVFSRVLTVLVIAFFFLTRIDAVYDQLVVQPGSVIPPQARIWTLVTGCFVEATPVYMIIDVLAILMNSKLYEPLWGTIEFAKFIVVVATISNLCTVLNYLFLYSMTTSLSFLFLHFGGMSSLWFGFVVAFKQAFPQKPLKIGGFSLESRLIPGACLLIFIGLFLLRVIPISQVMLAAYGLLVSWIHLRFFQLRDGTKGDSSESFAFADFFPSPLQTPVSIIGSRVFKLAVLIRLCPKEPQQYDLSGPSAIRISLPGVTQGDADRRKQLALRDLDSRLKAGTPAKTPNGAVKAQETPLQAAAGFAGNSGRVSALEQELAWLKGGGPGDKSPIDLKRKLADHFPSLSLQYASASAAELTKVLGGQLESELAGLRGA